MQMAGKKNPSWVSANVACDRLNFRRAPSLSSDVIKILEKGAPLSVKLDESSEWVRAKIDNDVGFVMRKFLSIALPVNPEVGEDG